MSGRHDFEALTEKLAKHGVGFTEILSADKVLAAPQAAAGDKLSRFGFGDYDFTTPDFPIPSLLRADAPPLLGEDTVEVLKTLGYDADTIDAMTSAGVMAERDGVLWSKPKAAATAGN